MRLQRSLLSDRLPEIEGVELIGRYNAGGAGLEIGGDWYDAVRRSDGIVHVTVGDVAGHGVTAAVLMGQLRNAFRAHAYEHTSPAERAAAHAAPRRRGRDGDGALPHARSVHPGAHLRLRRPSAVAARRRRRRRRLAPRPRARAAARLRAALRDPRGDGRAARRRARSWPTPTGSSSAAAGASTPASTCWPRCSAPRPRSPPSRWPTGSSRRSRRSIGSHRRHRAADRPAARGAAAHGHRGAERARRRWPACAGGCARGSSCAGSPTTSATTRSSPSARPATTRSSTPTTPSPGRSACCSSTARARSRSASRIAAAGSPTAPSFERGRGIPLMRAVMDMTTIEHDERGTSVTLSRAARLSGDHPCGCRRRKHSVVCGVRSEVRVSTERQVGNGQGRVRVEPTRPSSRSSASTTCTRAPRSAPRSPMPPRAATCSSTSAAARSSTPRSSACCSPRSARSRPQAAAAS